MFNKATETISRDRHNHSIVQEGVTVKGEIQADGDVRLDGRLEGRISATERVTIGATGSLVADVEAGEVIIMGSVEGNVRAQKRLELKKGARVVGNITTPVLVVEEGVHFHGTSNMSPESASNLSFGILPGGKTEGLKDEKKDDPLDAVFPR
jgi:cytoskeletal protein CcmA (bactofilin family)